MDLRRLILISPQELQVTLTVGKKLTDFLIDMGATYSVVNTKVVQKTSVYPGHGSFWRTTKLFVLTTSRMPTRGPYPETYLLIYARVFNPPFGMRSPL